VRRGGALMRRDGDNLHGVACAEGATTSRAALVLPLRFAPEGAEADDSEEQMPVRRSGCCGAERSGGVDGGGGGHRRR